MQKVFITSCMSMGLLALSIIIIFGLYLLFGFTLRLISKLKIYKYIKDKINFDWETTGLFIAMAALIIYVFIGFYQAASKILG